MITKREKQLVDVMVFIGNPVAALLHYQFGILQFVKSKYWRVPVATFGGYSVGNWVTSKILFAVDDDESKISDGAKVKASVLCGISLAACGAYLSIKE